MEQCSAVTIAPSKFVLADWIDVTSSRFWMGGGTRCEERAVDYASPALQMVSAVPLSHLTDVVTDAHVFAEELVLTEIRRFVK